MPPAKRSSSTSSRSSSPRTSSSSRSAKRTQSAARTGAKSTATSTRKAAGRTTTQAKSGARATATAATGGAKDARSTAKGAATRTRRASGSDNIIGVAEGLVRGIVNPRDLVMLTRDRIQETLDDAAARGRVTRKDANELVSELVRRGRSERDDLRGDLETLIKQGRGQLESASRRARNSGPGDRVVRGADRARRTVGVGPAFPILGYDDLNASQVQKRLKELSRPEQRKVLSYERKHANRKSVVGALEKSLA